MWWAPTTEFFAYLDRGSARLRSGAGFRPAAQARDLGRIARGQLPQALREASAKAGTAQRRLHVLLGSSLCRFTLLENTGRLNSDAEVLALAAVALKDRLGLEPSEWIGAVDRQWDQSALVCAVRAQLLEELRAAASFEGCRLASVRPWIGEFLRVRGGQARKLRSLGVIEPDAASLLSGQAGATLIQTIPCSEGADPLDAIRYLIGGAGGSAAALPVVRFEAGAGPARRDFVDCATAIQSLA